MRQILIRLLCVCIALTWLPTGSHAIETGTGWHGFKGGAGHTGFVDQTMDRTLGLQWRYFFGGDAIQHVHGSGLPEPPMCVTDSHVIQEGFVMYILPR